MRAIKLSMMMLFLLMGLVLVSCQSKKRPEDVLRAFIKSRFASNVDKDEILSYTTGEFYDRISEMTEDEYKNFSDMSNYIKKRFEIHRKECANSQCFLTYTIRYDIVKESNKKTFAVEIKKISEMIRDESGWKIAKVDNVKSFFDSKEEIAP